jgi:hypothetical protein
MHEREPALAVLFEQTAGDCIGHSLVPNLQFAAARLDAARPGEAVPFQETALRVLGENRDRLNAWKTDRLAEQTAEHDRVVGDAIDRLDKIIEIQQTIADVVADHDPAGDLDPADRARFEAECRDLTDNLAAAINRTADLVAAADTTPAMGEIEADLRRAAGAGLAGADRLEMLETIRARLEKL